MSTVDDALQDLRHVASALERGEIPELDAHRTRARAEAAQAEYDSRVSANRRYVSALNTVTTLPCTSTPPATHPNDRCATGCEECVARVAARDALREMGAWQ